MPFMPLDVNILTRSGVSGLVYGAFQSYSRAVFSELIPPGEEARWYAAWWFSAHGLCLVDHWKLLSGLDCILSLTRY